MLILALAAAATTTPRFDALRFFAGRTEGRGRLHVAMSHPRDVRVHGRGVLTGDTLVLDQRVEPAGKPATTRSWRLHRTAPGRYAGTLTDAVGPVTAESTGDRLHIAYRAKHGVHIQQWLTLSTDGRSAQNRLTAKKFGIVVARLDETIRKSD